MCEKKGGGNRRPDVGVRSRILTRPVVGPASAPIPHRDAHEYVSAVGVKAHHQRFLVLTALFTQILGMDYRGINLEVKTLVIERGHSAADHHVGELAYGLTRDFLALRHR